MIQKFQAMTFVISFTLTKYNKHISCALCSCKKSPGFLVMSDSDSDCIRDSPKVRQVI